MRFTLREQLLAAFFAAIIAILSQITIPLGLIPLTGQTFAIGLAVTFLGKKIGSLAIAVYLLMGLIGLPVFAGMSGGIGVLFGPTGGFLVGFIFNGLITGWLLEKTAFTYSAAIVANIVGAAITLVIGMCWLKISASMTWSAAFTGGVLPFLLPGILKALAAAYLGIFLRRRLYQTFLTRL